MLEQVIQEISEEHAQNATSKRKRTIVLKQGPIRHKKEEAFEAVYSTKTIELEANNPLSAAFGLGFFATAIDSGHYADFLGKSQPHIALRPLWFGCDAFIPLTEAIGLNVPSYLLEGCPQKIHQICKRVIELGYNGIMFGVRENAPSDSAPCSAANLATLFQLIRKYRLKVIIKPHFIDPKVAKNLGRSPYNQPYKKYVQGSLKQFFALDLKVDYLYWEGAFFYPDCIHHPSAKAYTQADLAKAEVGMLEKAIYKHTDLIYCLPAVDLNSSHMQAHWFPKFCDDVGNRTSLAFPVVAGEPCSDHLPLHPFWEVLRKCPDASYTKLMPIMNIGAIKQGEGLWPCLSVDLFDRYISRCYRHHFGGIIGLVNHLPAKGGLLDCNLWIASQMMWRKQKGEILAETWFAAHRPEWDYSQHIDVLKQVREIVIALSLLRSLTVEKNRDSTSHEECKLMIDSLAAQVKHLKLVIAKKSSKKAPLLAIPQLYACFLKDAENIILHFLQCFNIPFTTSICDPKATNSFWTENIQGTGIGMRASAKIKFLDTPKAHPSNSLEDQILHTNFFRFVE